MAAIEVRGLVVRYGDRAAVDGLSFSVEAGEVVALLGPNGAGKTTTVDTLAGYRRPAEGSVRVLGLDPRAGHAALAGRLGLMPQDGGVHPGITPAEALRLYASFHDRPEDRAALLARLGLEEVAGRTWRRLSGGERQRLSLALALVGRPEVAFLDEPTAGVDPHGRLAIRAVVRELAASGVAVLLTTHELDEAERVADRVVIVQRGRLVAEGTPAELAAAGTGGGEGEIRFAAPPGVAVADLGAALGAAVEEVGPGEYRVAAAPAPAAVAALTAWLAERDLPLADLRAGRPRLEDVFLRLTGDGGAPPPGLPATPPATERGEAEATGAGGPAPRRRRRSPPLRARAVAAQARVEAILTLRRGESVLLTLVIPVLLLAFFSLVEVLPLPAGVDEPVDFLAPGVLALAVLSTAMTGLGIATAFERQYGVLKRLGATPLGRPGLVAAKTLSVLAVEAVQVAVLVPVAFALGWRPGGGPAGALGALAAAVLGTAAFAGLGLLMAGTLRAEAVLAAANGLYLALLLVGGIMVPLGELPAALRAAGRALPAGALADAARGTLSEAAGVPARAWVALAAWAVAAPAAASATFRWE